MSDCAFCKVSSGEIESHTIYEDENTRAFLDLHPLTLGHTLVIPKVHAMNILDLPDDGVGGVFYAVKEVTGILQKTLRCDGFTIGINHGRVSGQEVEHLHIHVIPRYEGDGGSSIQSVVHDPPKEDIKEIAEKIIKAN